MDAWVVATGAAGATPLLTVDRDSFDATIAGFGPEARQWCEANAFTGESGRFLALPGTGGAVRAILAGCDRRDAVFTLSSLPVRLPEGRYALDPRGLTLDAGDVALGWALGAYQFKRYRKPVRPPAQLVVDAATVARSAAMAAAVYQVRDLINTPTEDLGPAELAQAVHTLADRHGAT